MRRLGFGVCLAAGALAGLAGCGEDARQRIGLSSAPPDEFAVVTRAPLALPPDYQLRPPAPGARRPQEAEIKEEARRTLIQSATRSVAPAGKASQGEAVLLMRLGADRADPAIRGEVDAESARLADASTGFIDRIIFWRQPEPPGEVVDAKREAQRLGSNAALGKPPAAGATPVIERRERGFLEGLIN